MTNNIDKKAELEKALNTANIQYEKVVEQNKSLQLENKELKARLDYAPTYAYVMGKYIVDVARTMPDDITEQDRCNNICYGLGGETGEILDYLKKVFYHKQPYESEVLSEEIGDLFWYMCALMYEFKLDFVHILEQNMRKRALRYPNGFNAKDSLLRRDKANG